MPSLHKRGDSWIVQVNELPGRPTITLGDCTKAEAQDFRERVRDLVKSRRVGRRLREATENWLDGLDRTMEQRLATLGLLEHVKLVPKLGDWCEKFLDSNPVKGQKGHRCPGTQQRYEHTMAWLKAFFPADRTLDSFRDHDAGQWREWLVNTARTPGGRELREATVRTHSRNARAIFNAAVKARLIRDNSFTTLECASVAGDKLHHFDDDETKCILDACSNVTWRLLIGLARYAGLRTPSETLAVTWDRIDWDEKTLRVYAQKTDRERVVPLRAELFDLLLTGSHELGLGGRIVDRSSNNLRVDTKRILTRAGIPNANGIRKIYQSFRASAENDFREMGVGESTYSYWLGHSPNVSRKHYVSPTDSEIQRVTGALHKCMQSIQESPSTTKNGPKKGGAVTARSSEVLRGAADSSSRTVDPEVAGSILVTLALACLRARSHHVALIRNS